MSKAIKIKNDGWINFLTGMGLKSKDKGRNSLARWEPVVEVEAEEIYSADEVNARFCDELPDEATREWIEWSGVSSEVIKAITDAEEKLNVRSKVREAWSLARMYGGSCLLMGTDDTDDYSTPLNINRVTKLRFLTVLTRWELTTDTVEGDVASPMYDMPLTYRLSVSSGKGVNTLNNYVIHHSRLIRFDGSYLPRRLRVTNDYWHDSVYTKALEALRGYSNAHASANAVLQDFDTPFIKIKNLAGLLASGQEAAVTNRVNVMNMCKSVMRMVIIDDDEEIGHLSRNLGGVEALVKKAEDRLVASTQMPRTRVLGESPGGLGSNGTSEDRAWYDYVARQQEKYLSDKLDRLFSVMLLSKMGPTKGQYEDTLTWQFKPLWQATENESADLYGKVAAADQIYLQNGVLGPDEIRASRFRPEGFSLNLNIDSFDDESFNERSDVLVQEGEEWVLYSQDKTKVLGRFETKEEAMKREREIMYFKGE